MVTTVIHGSSKKMKHILTNQFQNQTRGDDGLGVNHDENRGLRALHILETLSKSSAPLTLSLIAYRVGAPKATILRLLRSMEVEGFVLRIPGNESYVLGHRAVKLSFNCLNSNTFLQQVRAILRDLVNLLGEACNFTIPFENEVLYLDRVNTEEVLRLHFEPGKKVPMYCTASGKLFLASFNEPMINQFYQEVELLPKTKKTIISQNQLNQELENININGYSTDGEEFISGMCAVAVPVRNQSNEVVAAIACHAPTARISLRRLIECRAQLNEASRKIEKLFFDGQFT
jgi:DNA-binding IclR family transcriptional regulator